jgi:hypothetical protein
MHEPDEECNGESGSGGTWHSGRMPPREGTRPKSARALQPNSTGQLMATDPSFRGMAICRMNQNQPDKNEKDFFKIVSISTSLAFGTMAAFLYSMKDITRDATLVFTPGTVIVFVAAAVAGWWFWRWVKARNEAKWK